ncbi:MAG: hypothetical protein ACRC7N_20395 [Clostridium sp.]
MKRLKLKSKFFLIICIGILLLGSVSHYSKRNKDFFKIDNDEVIFKSYYKNGNIKEKKFFKSKYFISVEKKRWGDINYLFESYHDLYSFFIYNGLECDIFMEYTCFNSDGSIAEYSKFNSSSKTFIQILDGVKKEGILVEGIGKETKRYYESGELEYEATYSGEELVQEKTYDEVGSLVEHIKYKNGEKINLYTKNFLETIIYDEEKGERITKYKNGGIRVSKKDFVKAITFDSGDIRKREFLKTQEKEEVKSNTFGKNYYYYSKNGNNKSENSSRYYPYKVIERTKNNCEYEYYPNGVLKAKYLLSKDRIVKTYLEKYDELGRMIAKRNKNGKFKIIDSEYYKKKDNQENEKLYFKNGELAYEKLVIPAVELLSEDDAKLLSILKEKVIYEKFYNKKGILIYEVKFYYPEDTIYSRYDGTNSQAFKAFNYVETAIYSDTGKLYFENYFKIDEENITFFKKSYFENNNILEYQNEIIISKEEYKKNYLNPAFKYTTTRYDEKGVKRYEEFGIEGRGQNAFESQVKKYYLENGKLYYLVNNELTFTYFENEQIKTEESKEYKKTYYLNGQLKAEYNYLNREKKEYYLNGKLKKNK